MTGASLLIAVTAILKPNGIFSRAVIVKDIDKAVEYYQLSGILRRVLLG